MIKKEVNAFEEMGRQLFLEIVDLNRTVNFKLFLFQIFCKMRMFSKFKVERIHYSKTLQGKYFNFLGYFFSIYCVWKIIISSINIIFDRVGKVGK